MEHGWGVDRSGRFAALTGTEPPLIHSPNPRGGLITQFLVGEQSPKAYMASLASTADYRGFNLLLMDTRPLFLTTGSSCFSAWNLHLCAIESIS